VFEDPEHDMLDNKIKIKALRDLANPAAVALVLHEFAQSSVGPILNV
jgi:hypothetical protein